MAMKKIIAVILALVVCVAGTLFGGDCASACVIGGYSPPWGYVYRLASSLVSDDTSIVSGDARKIAEALSFKRRVSHDTSKVADPSIVVMTDCFGKRPKGIWGLISAMMTLIVAFIAELIW